MRAYEIREGFGIDRLQLVDRPEPRPAAGQVVVRVHAVSLNYRDLMVVTGTYNPKLRLPAVPFSDAAGVVAEVGDGVTRFKAGDRVAPIFMQKWIEGPPSIDKSRSSLGAGIPGTLQEYVVLDQGGLVRIPEHLSFEEGATLPCAAVTAWHALVTLGGIRAGDTILTQGTGGVSLFAIQFAALSGARAMVTSSSDEKLERARALGAHAGINYKERVDWEKGVLELTENAGVDQVVELGGSGSLNQSLEAVKIGGRISIIGVLAGGGEVSTALIIRKCATIQGIFVGPRTTFEEMNRAIAAHHLRPVIDRTFPFREARDALRHLKSGRHFGKICIRVGED